MSQFDKSKIAPTSIRVMRDYYILGVRYFKNLLVTSLPDRFGLGMLSFYISDQNIKLFMISEKSYMDIPKALRNELREKKQSYTKSKDDVVRERLAKDIDSLDAYIKDFVNSGDVSHNVLMVFSVAADTLEELNRTVKDLKSRLQVEGFSTVTLQFMQLELMKYSTPYFIEDALPKVLKESYGSVTTSTSVAGMYPYTIQSLKDPGGMLFGREKNQAGIVMWNPMLYKHDKERARIDNRLTGNSVVVGVSGSGKSTDMGLIIRHAIRQKIRIVWIDHEDRNMYLTRKYGGNFVKWGTRDSMINMFDLKPISTEEGEDVDRFDTESAMLNVISEFKEIMKLYKPTVNEDALNIISPVIIKMYKTKGIDFNTRFEYLGVKDYPILEDLNHQIDFEFELLKDDSSNQGTINLLRDLQSKMLPMLTEHKYYFNGHTTIKMGENGSEILAFGSKQLYSVSVELRSAMNHLMFRFAWSLCLDPKIDSLFAVDEAHMMILEGLAAEQLAIFWRRARKYNNACLLGTQEPQDLASDVQVNGVEVSVHGKAIFNNSPYKIIKKLNKDGVESVSRLMTINDSQKQIIQDFDMGDALFCYGDRVMSVSVLATEKELKEFEMMG